MDFGIQRVLLAAQVAGCILVRYQNQRCGEMCMNDIRTGVVNALWRFYKNATPQMQTMTKALHQQGVEKIILDHFAIIDLPGKHSGMEQLKEIFSLLNFVERGRDYLPEKQNDFLWMTEEDSEEKLATDVLPQVVVADFRLEIMPEPIKKIIELHARYVRPFPFKEIKQQLISSPNYSQTQTLITTVVEYLTTRDWPAPTLKEYQTVQEYNELLAWVLVFGRQPNHFTLSLHLLNHFLNFASFQTFVETTVRLPLNLAGGKIKGSVEMGIQQGSTLGTPVQVALADANITVPSGFVEFVWRYPQNASKQIGTKWRDFYTGFIARQANHVIESVYNQA